MSNTDDNSRRNFFKKLPFSIFSTIALTGLVFHEANTHSKSSIKSISKQEANEIIRNLNSNQNITLAPKPAPNKNA